MNAAAEPVGLLALARSWTTLAEPSFRTMKNTLTGADSSQRGVFLLIAAV
ncbi:hypothetical protein ACFSBV_01755 [Brevibacterium otitidis]